MIIHIFIILYITRKKLKIFRKYITLYKISYKIKKAIIKKVLSVIDLNNPNNYYMNFNLDKFDESK